MFNDLIEIDDIVISNYYDVYDEDENKKVWSIIPIKRLKNGDILAVEFYSGKEIDGIGKYYKSLDDKSYFYELDIDARYQRLKQFFRYVFQGKKIEIS